MQSETGAIPTKKTTNHEWTRMNTHKLIDELLIWGVMPDIERFSACHWSLLQNS